MLDQKSWNSYPPVHCLSSSVNMLFFMNSRNKEARFCFFFLFLSPHGECLEVSRRGGFDMAGTILHCTLIVLEWILFTSVGCHLVAGSGSVAFKGERTGSHSVFYSLPPLKPHR